MKQHSIKWASLVGALAMLLAGCNFGFSSSSSSQTSESDSVSESESLGSSESSEQVDSSESSSITESSADSSESSSETVNSEEEGYKLVWSDEFDGTSLDTSKWEYQIGDGSNYGIWGWGNNEQQYYTNGQNARIDNGVLIISAKKEAMGSQSYTSTRIRTKAKAFWTYGRFEARISYDCVQGLWPAFWMLPEDGPYGGWPASGEIDIMEGKGRLPYWSSHALHFGSTNPYQHQYESREITLTTPASNYHVYAVEWTAEYIAWFIDDVETYRLNNDAWWSGASSSASAPFDQPFHILLNFAVGGNFDGGITPPDTFTSADMRIDYVRVYQYQ